MQSRSWMAASLAIAALGAHARADDPPVTNTVKLELQIAGLGPQGCAVEVRPAHPGCQFSEVVTQVRSSPSGSSRTVRLPALVIDARSTGADRDCTFAITIREPNRPAMTFRRGLRLAPQVAGRPTPVRTLSCYLSSPSLAAKNDTNRTRQ
jgi:hypothetical protein